MYEFLTWWIGQLASLIPEGWRQLGSGEDHALLIAPVGSLARGIEAADFRVRRNGSETPLGRFSLAAGGLANMPNEAHRLVVLQLAQTDVLSKTVSLPLAAEHDLHQVLAFEMDRETPFSPDQLFWSHEIEERDRQNGKLSVRLRLIPRASLATLLAVLGRADIIPKRAEIADGPDRGRYLPLQSNAARAQDMAGRVALLWMAVGCCAALALAALVTPFVLQSLALARVDHDLAEGRHAAAETEQLRKEITLLSGRVNLIGNEREKAGHPLATLALLTGLTADDSYLTEFQQQQQKITLSGRSASASRVIGALASSDRLRNPAFAAPVTRIEGLKVEAFTITAEVAP